VKPLQIDALGNWRRTHYSTEVEPELDEQEVTVFGWVEEIRDLGGIRFIVLRDKGGIVQVTIPRNIANNIVVAKADSLQKQYVIGVRGVVKKMEKAPHNAEIIPKEIKILNTVQHPLSLDPTGRTPADIDVRLNSRILDLRRPECRAIFQIQHVVNREIRNFFSNLGFIEVHTPKIISSATEGGAALFPIAYFEREAFLAQSPQLYKEGLVSDFEKVYEIAPFFRAEESHTTRHISEFISVDIEEAFVDAKDVMRLLEDMLLHVFRVVKNECKDELKTLNQRLPILKLPFPKYTYDQIVNELKDRGVQIPWGEDIPTPAFRTLGEIHPNFYFITDWPTKSKPFYIKPRDNAPKLCEAFDLMYGWIEVASGGTRIHDKKTIIKRLRKQGFDPKLFEYHLKTFDYGMPPHAGWGLGLARLLMVITGKENIREVVLFPRDRFRLTP